MTQLREPWFLNGRQTVPSRMLYVSLVLGGSAFFSGFVPVSSHLLLQDFGFVPRARAMAVAEVANIVTVSFVAMGIVPLYSRLLRQTSVEAAIRAVWVAWLLTVPFVWGEAAYSMLTEAYLQLSHRYSRLFPEGRMSDVSRMTILWLGLCTAYFRWSRQWLSCMVLSFVGVILSGHIDVLPTGSWSRLQTLLGVNSTTYQLLVIVIRSARYGQGLALVVIPWGLPLWFPPKQTGRVPLADA